MNRLYMCHSITWLSRRRKVKRSNEEKHFLLRGGGGSGSGSGSSSSSSGGGSGSGSICPGPLQLPVAPWAPGLPALCVCLSFILCPALEFEWPELDKLLLCAADREEGGVCVCVWGGHIFNEMRNVNGHSLWRGQEEKGALPHFSTPLSSVPLSLSLSLLPSSPAGEGLCSAPDDTPDAPALPPLLVTFTSLPSGQRSPPGIWMGLRGNSGHGGCESGRVFLPGCHGQWFSYKKGYKRTPKSHSKGTYH